MTSAEKTTSPANLDALLGTSHTRPWWQRPVLWLGVALLLGGAGGYAYWQQQQSANTAPRFVSEPVQRGNLTLTVSVVMSRVSTLRTLGYQRCAPAPTRRIHHGRHPTFSRRF